MTQHPFVFKKILKKIGKEGPYSNLIRAVHEKSAGNIIHEENLKASFLKTFTKKYVCYHHFCSTSVFKYLEQLDKTKK